MGESESAIRLHAGSTLKSAVMYVMTIKDEEEREGLCKEENVYI